MQTWLVTNCTQAKNGLLLITNTKFRVHYVASNFAFKTGKEKRC